MQRNRRNTQYQPDALARRARVAEPEIIIVDPARRRELETFTIDAPSHEAARRKRRRAQEVRRKARQRVIFRRFAVGFSLLLIAGLTGSFFLPGAPARNWLDERLDRAAPVLEYLANPEAFEHILNPPVVTVAPVIVAQEEVQPTAAPPTEAPVPTPTPFYVQRVAALPETETQKLGLRYDLFKDGKKVDAVEMAAPLAFEDAGSYTDIAGVLTFRGDHLRQGNAYGTAGIAEAKLEKLWQFSIGGIDSWTGVGWNGQPALVQWPEDLRRAMNIAEEKQDKDGLIEGIYATLDGKIYFFDAEDGEFTRDPIVIGFPIKGSVSVDPRGVPLLYSGQGISKNNGKRGKIGYHVFSLLDSEKLYFINGGDDNRYRGHGAFDSVGLVDAASDTLLIPGENGIFYAAHLNTEYDAEAGTLSLDPTLYSYRYKSDISEVVGTENSLAMYGHYGYFADNSGLLTCMDMNTLTPVWTQNVTDDTDSTVALEIEEGGSVALYTACEVDLQGSGGKSYIRRLNALTGEIEWEYAQNCVHNADTNGGALSSPLVGKESLEGLVYFNISRVEGGGGRMLAFDKKTGELAWEKSMKRYGWSSPVGVYDEDGKGYVLHGDANGTLRLIDGLTGETLDEIELGSNIEGSPAVFGDIAVVGTRGQKIYGVKIL